MKTISDEIRMFVKRSYEDGYMDPKELLALADRIDRELVELPRDADGVPIHAGDTVWVCSSGTRFVVDELHMTEGGWAVFTTNAYYVKASGVAHAEPDSFERIAYELAAWCGSVDVDGDACDVPLALVERIRNLAAKEDE